MKNSTVFITGATAGFGKACARRFAHSGSRVILAGRRTERLEALAAELAPLPVHIITLDVRNAEAVEQAVRNLPDGFRDVDILINNAGLALGLETLDALTLGAIDQMVDTNIKGVLYCTHALLPGMIARNKGHIINLGSIAGTYPYPYGNVYGATKAFVAQFSLNLRAELLGKHIRVTNIEPGMCDTEFSTVRFGGDKKAADEVYEGMQPLSAEDIAETIHWCASLPAHVNINRLEVMPVMQAFSPFAVRREGSA